MTRHAIVALAGAAAVLLGVLALRYEAPSSVSSPSPTASPTLSPTPTAAVATPSATPLPSPTPSTSTSTYVSPTMGYAIDLPAPWHYSPCGSSTSGPLEGSDGGEIFTPVSDRDFRFTDTGLHVDRIEVAAQANPDGLSPRKWESSGRIGGSVGRVVQDVTFAGRPALLVGPGPNETFLVANAGYMYQVSHVGETFVSTAAERAAIVRSFRFLTAAEARTAATQRPARPPRSPEVVADALADGFAKRDVAILRSVASRRCIQQAIAQDGASATNPEPYLTDLERSFAQGLTVDVRARPITGERDRTLFVRSTWREPGKPDRDVDLMIVVEGQTAYWTGTLTYLGPRP